MKVPRTNERTFVAVARPHRRWSVVASAALVAFALSIGVSTAGAASSSASTGPVKPSKALCKKSSYKIGYDVFSGTQPFANLVTKGLYDAAKAIGCVTIVKTVDNLNGPVAVGNLKTLLNQKIDGFVDFQVLAPFQNPIAKALKSAKIPGVAIVGADLPGSPSVGADNYGASVLDGRYLGAVSKQRYPSAIPYAVVAAEPSAGAIVMQRYFGAVAGIKQMYPKLPSDHVIQVKSDGTETGTYNNVVSALSRIPSDGVVLMTGVNDEVVHGMYKAAAARHLKNYLVNSFGGDPFGLQQVCADRTHYVGALYLLPETWGSSALAVILAQINGTSFPKAVGIKGKQVTAKSPETGCK
jgi:ABC-type sugar transport system substrate-binding protein